MASAVRNCRRCCAPPDPPPLPLPCSRLPPETHLEHTEWSGLRCVGMVLGQEREMRTDPLHRIQPARCTAPGGRTAVAPAGTAFHQIPGQSPPETSRRSPTGCRWSSKLTIREEPRSAEHARPLNGPAQIYLGVVGGAAPAADSLTPRLVSVGWLTGGGAESSRSMPAQQGLSLQGETKVTSC